MKSLIGIRRRFSTSELKTQWRQTFVVGFDGAQFRGSANQKGLRTVEGEILEGLKKMGLAEKVYDFPKGCLL